MTFDQTGFDQQFQVARNTRLRLAKDMDELRHGDFGLAEKREQAKTRDFACCFQPGEDCREGGVLT